MGVRRPLDDLVCKVEAETVCGLQVSDDSLSAGHFLSSRVSVSKVKLKRPQ